MQSTDVALYIVLHSIKICRGEGYLLRRVLRDRHPHLSSFPLKKPGFVTSEFFAAMILRPLRSAMTLYIDGNHGRLCGIVDLIEKGFPILSRDSPGETEQTLSVSLAVTKPQQLVQF